MRRAPAIAAAAVVCAVAAMLTVDLGARAQSDPTADAVTAGPEGVLSAEFDAFAFRAEYDIPLPASAGTVPHVVGEVRRSTAGENAKGIAAAPSHFDAVVGGTYYDPDKSQKGDENLPPQTECFYPGALVDTEFAFPTDTRAETEAAPATSYATAQCGAGPSVQLRAAVASTGDSDQATVRGAMAEGVATPKQNRLHADAVARADGISLAGGAITVGAVEAVGASSVTGKPGEGASHASVKVADINVAGVVFSIANDELVVAGNAVPIDTAAADAVIDAANTALRAAAPGCRVDVTTQPETFPQGFLLSRKPPAIGIAEDGTAAASMRAGLQLLCDIPQQVSEPTGFSPQRLQAVIGFVYTGTFANAEPGGFSLGALGGSASFGGDFSPLPTALAAPDVFAGSIRPDALPGAPAAEAATAIAPPAPADAASSAGDAGTRLVRRYRTVAVAATPMATTSRVLLGLLALAGWLALTHLGLRRLRGVTQP